MAASRCVCVVSRNFVGNGIGTLLLKHEMTLASFRQFCLFGGFISRRSVASRVPGFALYSSKTGADNAEAATLGTVKLKGLADDLLKSHLQAEKTADAENKQDSSAGGTETEEEKKKREASWKAMKYTLAAFGVSFAAFGVYLLVEWGAPLKDDNGNPITDEFTHLPLVQQYILRMWREVNYYKKMIKDPSRDKLLPDPLQEPYYQPPYTLILEMTGVLVHPDWTYKTGWRFKKRPGVDFFLSQIASPLFEVVVYTAEQGFTAFPILDALDPNGFISYRLVRDATRYVDGHHVKDLDCLNRDLSKVIVVDCNEHSVKFHSRNSILLPKWKGNDDDHMLIDLAFFLRMIATSEVGDVREVLDFYHQYENPVEAFKENQRRLQEQQEELQRQQKERQDKAASLTGGWTPSFLNRRR